MKAGLGHVEFAPKEAVVELLDVNQRDVEVQAPPVDGARHQTMKRERVIGTGRNSESDWDGHS